MEVPGSEVPEEVGQRVAAWKWRVGKGRRQRAGVEEDFHSC